MVGAPEVGGCDIGGVCEPGIGIGCVCGCGVLGAECGPEGCD